MKTAFEDLVANLITKDSKLTELLKVKIAEALEKIELIGSLQATVDQALENIDLSDAISTPIKETIGKIISQKLVGK